MKAYKGFDKNMKCRNFQYEEGKEYFLKDGAGISLGNNGFHSCENPLHIFRYYSPATSIFREVEASGEINKEEKEDTKIVSSQIKIGAGINFKSILEIGMKFIFDKIKWGKEDTPQTHGDYSAAQTHGSSSAAQTHGDYSAAQTHGYSSAAQTHGNSSAAQTHGDFSAVQTHGDSSAAQTHGDYSAAQTHGYSSAAQTHGNYSAAQTHGFSSAAQTHGDFSAAQTHGDSSTAQTHGYSSAAQTHGDSSAAQTHGDSSAAQTHGNESIAVSTGYQGKASGIKGNWIVLCEWCKDNAKIKTVKSVKIDGIKIKADTFYMLKNGKFIKAK